METTQHIPADVRERVAKEVYLWEATMVGADESWALRRWREESNTRRRLYFNVADRILPLLRTPRGEGEAEALAAEILAELRRAREKFPGDNVTTLALVEEVGELAKATFEESRDRVRQEAIQVAVMAMRVVLDGDQTLDAWRESKGLDPLTAARQGEDEDPLVKEAVALIDEAVSEIVGDCQCYEEDGEVVLCWTCRAMNWSDRAERALTARTTATEGER